MVSIASQYAKKVLAEYDAWIEKKSGIKFKYCKLCDAVIRLDGTCSNSICEKHREEQ